MCDELVVVVVVMFVCVCGREEDGGLPLLQMIENKRIIYFCVCGEIGDMLRIKSTVNYLLLNKNARTRTIVHKD